MAYRSAYSAFTRVEVLAHQFVDSARIESSDRPTKGDDVVFDEVPTALAADLGFDLDDDPFAVDEDTIAIEDDQPKCRHRTSVWPDMLAVQGAAVAAPARQQIHALICLPSARTVR